MGNKYDVIPFNQLVLYVQREKELDYKKMSTRKKIRILNEVSEAENAIRTKVNGMSAEDRAKNTFFPIGSKVYFANWQGVKEEGEVVGHLERYVKVMYKKDLPYGEPQLTLPKDLSLKNIKL